MIRILFGISIPSYKTFKSFKEKKTRYIVYWNIYWITFGTYKLCTLITDNTLYWLPFYDLFKAGFIIWLSSTTTKVTCTFYLVGILGTVWECHWACIKKEWKGHWCLFGWIEFGYCKRTKKICKICHWMYSWIFCCRPKPIYHKWRTSEHYSIHRK